MNSIEDLNKATNYITKNSLKQDSMARLCCLLTLDAILIGGWLYLLIIILQDEDYWQTAPLPFYIFILSQYFLLALIIRVPISTACKAKTISICVCLISIVIKVNLGIGVYQLYNLVNPEEEQTFVLKPVYKIWGFILICIPGSVLLFMIIITIKLFCFFIAERNQKRHSQRHYGVFEDDAGVQQEQEDPAAMEAVVGVYFQAMEKIDYETIDESHDNFMTQQKQCRLCLQYFHQGEQVMKIPICDHIFHGECLKKWLVEWQKCPSCDRNIIHLPEGQKDKYKE